MFLKTSYTFFTGRKCICFLSDDIQVGKTAVKGLCRHSRGLFSLDPLVGIFNLLSIFLEDSRAVQLSRCFSSGQCSFFAAFRVGSVVRCGGRLGPPCALARGGMGQQAFWGQVSSATSPCELRTIFFSDVVRHSVRPPHPQLLSGRGSQGLRHRSCNLLLLGRVLVHHQASMNSCHLVLHIDTLVGQYFSAVLRVWHVSAFSIQLYWRGLVARGVVLHALQVRGVAETWWRAAACHEHRQLRADAQ